MGPSLNRLWLDGHSSAFGVTTVAYNLPGGPWDVANLGTLSVASSTVGNNTPANGSANNKWDQK